MTVNFRSQAKLWLDQADLATLFPSVPTFIPPIIQLIHEFAEIPSVEEAFLALKYLKPLFEHDDKNLTPRGFLEKYFFALPTRQGNHLLTSPEAVIDKANQVQRFLRCAALLGNQRIPGLVISEASSSRQTILLRTLTYYPIKLIASAMPCGAYSFAFYTFLQILPDPKQSNHYFVRESIVSPQIEPIDGIDTELAQTVLKTYFSPYRPFTFPQAPGFPHLYPFNQLILGALPHGGHGNILLDWFEKIHQSAKDKTPLPESSDITFASLNSSKTTPQIKILC